MSKRTTRSSRSDSDPAPSRDSRLLGSLLPQLELVTLPSGSHDKSVWLSAATAPSCSAATSSSCSAATATATAAAERYASSIYSCFWRGSADRFDPCERQAKTVSFFAALNGRVDNLATQVTTEATATADHRKTTDDSLSDIEAHLPPRDSSGDHCSPGFSGVRN